MMDSIFVVEAVVDYEGSAPVRAFPTKYEADEFARECNDHLAKRPEFPKDEATVADIQQWVDAEKAWSEAHEAGQQGSPDRFSCVQVPFGPAQREVPDA